jgi:hypothetical protein
MSIPHFGAQASSLLVYRVLLVIMDFREMLGI